MVVLKVNLPHLSLSRPSSKRGEKQSSTSPAANSRPPTPSTAPATLSSSTASHSSNSSAGGSPPQGSTAPSSVEGGTVSPLLQPTNGDRKQGERRSSMGALGAALRRTVTASTPITSPTISPAGSGTTTPRTTSDGQLPPRTGAPAAFTSSTKPIPPREKLKRSPKSGQVPTAVAAANPAALSHSHSQPPSSRLGVLAAGIARAGSAKVSPAITPHVHGSQTPVGPAAPRAAPVGALEESYVAKVSQRLAEAVNRVFAAPAAGSHALGDLSVGGRLAPRVDRAKDAADMVCNELAAAMPDAYLLKTIIRSSVLKALSLYITRLSALLLACPSLTLPLPAQLPVEVRFNLAVVRAAHTMATGLREAGRLHGAPAFVAETLNPWAIKMDEITARVMTPLMNSLRAEIVRITVAAQPEHALAVAQPAVVAAPASKAHLPTASSLRALSLPLSRSASPAPAARAGPPTPPWLTELGALLESFGKMIRGMECGPTGDRWLVTLGTFALWKSMLSLSARVIDSSTEVPAAVVAAHPVGKTLFAASAKLKAHQPVPSPSNSPELRPSELGPGPGSRASSHSRALSPGRGSTVQSPRDRALQGVVNELEMLEARMLAFTAYLSGPLAPAAPWTECCVSPSCELCRTGRGFDPQSDSEDEQVDSGHGLAQDAFREALQTLSAMIVVAIATKYPPALRKALQFEAGDGKTAPASPATAAAANQPLTPAAMLGMMDINNEANTAAAEMAKSTSVGSTSSLGAQLCPTLRSALPEVPALLVLSMLIARLPGSLGFRQPHELFNLDGFAAYAVQLKSFAQSEEWEGELAFEVEQEIDRVEAETKELTREEKDALESLEEALKTVEVR